MTPETRAQLQAILDSGKMSPEDAEQAKKLLATHDEPAPEPSPGEELLNTSNEDLEAYTEAEKKRKADRLAALDAGEADMMFEANRTGDPGSKGIKQKTQATLLRIFGGNMPFAGATPGQIAQAHLYENPDYVQERAELGDESAQYRLADRDVRVKGAGLGASAFLGGVLGPARTALGALAKGGAASGGGQAVESAAAGESLPEAAKNVGAATLVGGGLTLGIHGAGALAQMGRNALRRHPDVGKDIQIAEEGGYQTSALKGLRPTKPTGRTPGKRGAEEEAADLAPKVMKAADATDDALTSAHRAELEAYYASPAGKAEVDSTPIIKEFQRLVRDRTFRDGQPIPETMWERLVNDAKAFSKVVRVPIEQADEVAAKQGGAVIPQGLLPPAGGGKAIPVTPGGRAMAPGNPPPGGAPVEAGPGAYHMPGPETAMARTTPPGAMGKPGAPAAPKQKVEGDYIPPGQPRGEQQYAEVLIPRRLTAKELEETRDAMDEAGKIANAGGPAKPLVDIANTARSMRSAFPGLDDMMARQSKEIGTVKNLRKAFGIPESKRLDAEDLAELRAVGDALQRYKAPGNLEADKVIQDFLAKNPEFAPQFQKLAGMGAAERVRGTLGGARAGVSKGGLIGTARDIGLSGALRLDPAMAALARARGGGSATSAAAGQQLGPEFTRLLFQMIPREPLEQGP